MTGMAQARSRGRGEIGDRAPAQACRRARPPSERRQGAPGLGAFMARRSGAQVGARAIRALPLGKDGSRRPRSQPVTRKDYTQVLETVPCVCGEHGKNTDWWQVSQEGDARSWRPGSMAEHPRHAMARPTARCVACENLNGRQAVRTASRLSEMDGKLPTMSSATGSRRGA